LLPLISSDDIRTDDFSAPPNPVDYSGRYYQGEAGNILPMIVKKIKSLTGEKGR